MAGAALTGRAVAAIGGGDAHHRAVAVAAAEAGASLALATFNALPAQEYAVHSIANEAWAVGREHLVEVMDASVPAAVGAFAARTWERFGGCDALFVVASLPRPAADASVAEKRAFAGRHRAPLLAAQAFGQLMRDRGSGAVVFVAPERDPADAKALNAALAAHLGAGGPRIAVVGRDAPAPEDAAAAALASLVPPSSPRP